MHGKTDGIPFESRNPGIPEKPCAAQSGNMKRSAEATGSVAWEPLRNDALPLSPATSRRSNPKTGAAE